MKCQDVTIVKNNSNFEATCNICDSITDTLKVVDLTENSTDGLYGICYPLNILTGCETYDNSIVDEDITQ